jgi:hypothetical protein
MNEMSKNEILIDNCLFDIIICVGPYDNDIIKTSLPLIKKNIIGYRNIYLICASSIKNIENMEIMENTIIINENIFPFTIDDIHNFFGKYTDRSGWYLQQLLKLYAGFYLPGILTKYLVIDADTHFLKPTKFISDDGKYYFNTGDEYHIPYFEHMNRLHPSFKKNYNRSGICHHCFFDNYIVKEMMEFVEKYHYNTIPFWKIFLNVLDIHHYSFSGASEYELYFNYIYSKHNDKIIIRNLKWKNSSILDENNSDNYDYVSLHVYLRKIH